MNNIFLTPYYEIFHFKKILVKKFVSRCRRGWARPTWVQIHSPIVKAHSIPSPYTRPGLLVNKRGLTP